jgi:type IV pilus assembly protein PilA
MVELLSVLVLIGLLGAIAVPAYLQQRDRARDVQAQADARAAQTAALEIGQENGRYNGPGGVSVANLVTIEPALADAELTVPSSAPDTFTVRVQSLTGNSFDITRNDNGTTDLTCASADDAGCPADGTWD